MTAMEVAAGVEGGAGPADMETETVEERNGFGEVVATSSKKEEKG